MTTLFILLLISCMIQVACLLPQAVKIGRESSKNNGFVVNSGYTDKEIELAKKDFFQRMLQYYYIKIKFLGMSINNFFEVVQITQNRITHLYKVYLFLSQMIVNSYFEAHKIYQKYYKTKK